MTRRYISQTNRGYGELFRHVWLESDDNIYDVSINILKNVSWKDHKVQFKHHKILPPDLRLTDQSNDTLDYGIALYQSSPFNFWSEFDNCIKPEIHQKIEPVINQLRDSFLGLN